VRNYVVDRYGEFVLLRPLFALHTLLLWLTPVLAILLGGFGIWRLARRRRPASARGLTAAEEAEVAALLRRE
jgi:cytochrome c-type biogenesis protein CcmH